MVVALALSVRKNDKKINLLRDKGLIFFFYFTGQQAVIPRRYLSCLGFTPSLFSLFLSLSHSLSFSFFVSLSLFLSLSLFCLFLFSFALSFILSLLSLSPSLVLFLLLFSVTQFCFLFFLPLQS